MKGWFAAAFLIGFGQFGSLAYADESGHSHSKEAADQEVSKAKTALQARVIEAPAPRGIAHHHLGRAVNNRFELIRHAKPLFAIDKKNHHHGVVNEWGARFYTINTSAELIAHGRVVWLSGSLSAGTAQRYAIHEAYQRTMFHEVDDTLPMRPAPAAAAYYIGKIYYGRTYTTVYSASAKQFSTSVRASFLAWGASGAGGAKLAVLQKRTHARGLKPKPHLLIGPRTEREVRRAYAIDKPAGPPVPIMVEYVPIPGRKIPKPKKFSWASGPSFPHVFIVVKANNDEWTRSGVRAEPGDIIVGFAAGKIRIGRWSGMRTPESSWGGLQMRMGSTTVDAGKKFVFSSRGSGILKFRVKDNKFSDNKGRYIVRLLVVRKKAIPTPTMEHQNPN